MGASCKEKLVGRVMVTSLSINGIDYTHPNYPTPVYELLADEKAKT